MILKVILILCLSRKVLPLNNGLALTPPMGWMSWGFYMCEVDCENKPNKCLNENLILSVADEFYMYGYQEAGYEYIIIDDCWSEKRRDKHGRLVPDRRRFPNGMKYIADYIHARGLKFGLYTSAGRTTCMRYPGSRDHLEIDANTFAMWDVDYVKFDGCFVEEDFLNTVYIDFGNYLNKTGRPMVYSCSWPYYIEYIYNHMPDYKSIGLHCNLWRNYHDVSVSWSSVKAIIKHYESNHRRMASYASPGQWNDPDMLILGTNALTRGQSRIQMSVYAVLSAPLIISCDVRQISDSDRDILLNPHIIAVDQNPLGLQAVPYTLSKSTVTLWVKKHLPMKGDQFHSTTFLFVNMADTRSRVKITPGKYGLNCTDGYTVLDVFRQTFITNITITDQITVTVPSEDAVFYTMFPL